MSNLKKKLRRKHKVDSNRDHRRAGRKGDESSAEAAETRTSGAPPEEGAERTCNEKGAHNPVQDFLYGQLIEVTEYRHNYLKEFTPYKDYHKEPSLIDSGLNTLLYNAGLQVAEHVRRRMANGIYHELLPVPLRADSAVIQRVSWRFRKGPFSDQLEQELVEAVIDEHFKDHLERLPAA